MYGGRGSDKFVIESGSGTDRITDFTHADRIVFDASSGVSDFGQLVFTTVGRDTKISWGTGDSLTINGIRPSNLSAADFTFSSTASPGAVVVVPNDPSPIPDSPMDTTPTVTHSPRASKFGHATRSEAPVATDEAKAGHGLVWDWKTGHILEDSNSDQPSRAALEGQTHELVSQTDSQWSNAEVNSNPFNSIESAHHFSSLSHEHVAEALIAGLESDAFTGLATGITIPSSEFLWTAMNGIGEGRAAIDAFDAPHETGQAWGGGADSIGTLDHGSFGMDALLNAIPGHGEWAQPLSEFSPGFDMTTFHPGSFATDAMAVHPDAVSII
jgi:hypothetical protein